MGDGKAQGMSRRVRVMIILLVDVKKAGAGESPYQRLPPQH